MANIFPPQGSGIVGLPDYIIKPVAASTYSTAANDKFLSVTYTATGAVAVTLSTVSLIAGNQIIIKDSGALAGTNNITVSTQGTAKIDGADTSVINGNYDSITVVSDGTNWWIV